MKFIDHYWRKTHFIDEKLCSLLNINIFLGWRLEPPGEILLFAVFVHFRWWVDQAFLLLVTFVRQKYAGYRRTVRKLDFRVQILFPFHHRVQRGTSRHVEHYERANCFLVVHPRHVSKSFLTWTIETIETGQ